MRHRNRRSDLLETEPGRQLDLSRSLFRAGNTNEAIALARRLLRLHPTLGKGWAHLAFMLNNAQKYDEALEAADRAVKYSPKFPAGYRNKGFALSSLGKFTEAVEHFDAALKRENQPQKRAQILYSKAYTLMLADRLEDSQQAATIALEEDPTNYKVRTLVHRLQRPLQPFRFGQLS